MFSPVVDVEFGRYPPVTADVRKFLDVLGRCDSVADRVREAITEEMNSRGGELCLPDRSAASLVPMAAVAATSVEIAVDSIADWG